MNKSEFLISKAIISKNSNFIANGNPIVHINQLDSTNDFSQCKFIGKDAFYSISHFPQSEIYSLNFSNYVHENNSKIKMNYNLNDSSLLSADSFFSNAPIDVDINYVGKQVSNDDIDKHFDETLNLINLKNDLNFSFVCQFTSINGIKGFDSATHVYSEKIDKSALSIILDHHLNNLNNHFCISGSFLTCPEDAIIFNNASLFKSNWKNYVRNTATYIYFYFGVTYSSVIDFSSFLQNGNHPNIFFETPFIVLQKDQLEGTLGKITIKGSSKKEAQILFQSS